MSRDHEVTGEGEGRCAAGSPRENPARIGAEVLFRDHALFVATFLQRLGVRTEEIDDLVQEVFLVAHRKGGYDDTGPAQPRSWLGAIAVLLARSHHRKLGRKRETLQDDALLSATSPERTPHECLETKESLARVQTALDQLDLEHRAAFVLYELEGVPCQAIAASFDVPVGTVYSRLHHARRRFTEVYAAMELDETQVGSPLSTVEGR